MELLFHEDNFEEEFKELLGFVDADITLASIKSEIMTATREMIGHIGKTTYESFVVLYKKGKPSPEEIEILHLVRYPIAMNAYRLAAPSKDLQHTANGRLMRTDEHQSRPFEWMIDRNNEVNDRKYFRGMDHLLEHLFEDEDFKSSDEYKNMKSYFVSTTKDFEQDYPIHSWFLLLQLQPGIKQAQELHIKPRVGKEQYELLLEQNQSVSGIEEENKVLVGLIKSACVFWSLSWAMSRLTTTLLPEGILQRYSGDRQTTKASKTPEGLQTRLADEKFKEDAMRFLKEIENHLSESNPSQEQQDTTQAQTNTNQDCDDLFASI